MGIKSVQKQKIQDTIRALKIKLYDNETKYNEFIKKINYDIKVKKNDMEDCDSRIKDLKNWLRKKEITESYYNNREELFKSKKSKHNAKRIQLEQKKDLGTKVYYEKQNNINRRIKELEQKSKVN